MLSTALNFSVLHYIALHYSALPKTVNTVLWHSVHKTLHDWRGLSGPSPQLLSTLVNPPVHQSALSWTTVHPIALCPQKCPFVHNLTLFCTYVHYITLSCIPIQQGPTPTKRGLGGGLSVNTWHSPTVSWLARSALVCTVQLGSLDYKVHCAAM